MTAMTASSLTLWLCAFLLLAAAFAAPSHQDLDLEEYPDVAVQGVRGVRLPRATCDLLSVEIMGNSLGHAACASHCLAMMKGFRGGRCKDGVCHCRR